jgi:mannosyltransferase OCH1-like enzyme
MIDKRFIRIWIGDTIPELFEQWWAEFKAMHPGWEFVTITQVSDLEIPEKVKPVIQDLIENSSCAGLSDILRVLAVYQLGGVYIDTDNMPLKPFDPLMSDPRVFLGKRSSVSFESAVIGSPRGHEAMAAVIKSIPKYYWSNSGRAESVRTGPAFLSSILFGRSDVAHHPIKYFYPYNGFGAPKRADKMKLFSDRENFPSMMYSAHLSNSIFGPKPIKFINQSET